MPKKSAVYGEYMISQDQSGTIRVLREFDNVKASLRAIADEVGFEYDEKWNTRQFGNNLVKDFVKRLILTKDKSWVRGDVLIDDKPIITGSLTPNWTHWHYLHSYNAHLPNKKVTWENRESWAELLG